MSWLRRALAQLLPLPPIHRTSVSDMTALRSVLATYNAGMQLGWLRKSSSALRAAPQRNQMTLIWIVCTPIRTIHSFARCYFLFSLLCHRLLVLFGCILNCFRLLSVAYRGRWFGGFKPPQKFRRYRWSPRSHEQEEPASRFPFVVQCSHMVVIY